MIAMDDNCSAIILSSGLSERMGQPKALLKWNRSVTFIEKIIDEFNSFGCNPVICMINEIIEPACNSLKAPENVRFIVNHHPDWGRFYSIKTGLNEVRDSAYCFIHNVDNPFVNAVTLKELYMRRTPEAWCSPAYKDKGGHPVLIPGTIIKEIAGNEDLNTTLADILSGFPKIIVELNSDSVLRNINTSDDFNTYFRLSD